MAYINCAEVAARIHARMCENDANGYSQSPRWGEDGPGPETVWVDGVPYTYNQGSYDCSSSVIKAWQLALSYTPYKGKLDGATYTGNMRDVFEKSGLFYSSTQDARRGDVYLNDSSHTALCQDGGHDDVYGFDCMSQFSINELGKATGGKVGDQTGKEAYIGPYKVYSKGWPNKLIYNGKADGNYDPNGQPMQGRDDKSIDELAREVIDGKWGTGEERKARLQAAGYDYYAVQNRVNELLANTTESMTGNYKMKGIDVSSWNGQPFNAATENAYKDSDFVIVKATQGLNYFNPCYAYARDRVLADGKLLGVYHYAAGGDPEAEARFFFNGTRGMIESGKAVPVIDWEDYQNKAFGDKEWVRRFVDAYHKLAGKYPMIYVSASCTPQVANCTDCLLWVAGYPKDNNTWNPGNFPYSITPWDEFAIWQYTSTNNVDRNVSNLTPDQWRAMAAANCPPTDTSPDPDDDFLDEITSDVERLHNKLKAKTGK